MNIDPYILTFSAVTVVATVFMGFWSARRSRTAHDFFVAGRSVSVGWNASAISGEYLSAASFMGIAGMVMSSGYDALWYPVCYACGYLFLLLFIAGPLRRFGAYTIPDFAEGRYDSTIFRKIAVVFVLFIGFFYTMPQMKGAGTTLGYIFQDLDFRGSALVFLSPHEKGEALKGLHYNVGVFLVGSVITLNVALGGMKGITLVQAFQYWAKMFAISVPVFVLMAVYGHYGKQLRVNQTSLPVPRVQKEFTFRPVNVLGETAGRGVDLISWAKEKVVEIRRKVGGAPFGSVAMDAVDLYPLIDTYANFANRVVLQPNVEFPKAKVTITNQFFSTRDSMMRVLEASFEKAGVAPLHFGSDIVVLCPFSYTNDVAQYLNQFGTTYMRRVLPEKAPLDGIWLNPFGPLTTKAAKTAAAAMGQRAAGGQVGKWESETNSPRPTFPLSHFPAIPLRPDLAPEQRVTVSLDSPSVAQVLALYGELTGRQLLPRTNSPGERIDELLNGTLARWKLGPPVATPDAGLRVHGDGLFTAAEVKAMIEGHLGTNGLALVAAGEKGFRIEKVGEWASGQVGAAAEKAWLAKHEKPLALLYTYSLIIALVCGTAGLPHILVRFYTNPDGVAAKRTTMWVMILIGVFYLFPPVFGVMGRNLMPSLYEGTGAKGTDKVVLELPRILNEQVGKWESGKVGEATNAASLSPAHLPTFSPAATPGTSASKRFPWGSILSGITCAGAFAAFMSTFSGLLVSMTGALAHDVYGRMLRPKSTPEERLRAFKICAVLCGGAAILLGFLVEKFEINKLVGWAFAIAATSYFPLLFLSTWWRNITMKGAASGMLIGGSLSLVAIASTMFADQAAWAKGLAAWYAVHPLERILAEQPAIWALPLALVLMIVVSKLTRRDVPADVRMKMLVLHAPEKLGLKQEYIQEHQAGH